jgi:large subunit ribosomal protein L15
VDQHTLAPPPGSKHARLRRGRGNAAGKGTYAGRGLKGQKARGKVAVGFEGGQIPLIRRLARKPGFRNALRIEFQAVHLRDLAARFDAGAIVDGEALALLRLIDDADQPFKVLADGEITHALTVRAPRLSASAKEAITAAGGSFEELAPAVRRVRNRIHRRRAAAEAAAAEA